jgi:hypothetical protein
VRGVDKPRRLLTIDSLGKLTMEKGVLDIHLVNGS